MEAMTKQEWALAAFDTNAAEAGKLLRSVAIRTQYP
jgi:hypothetical protein